MVKIQEIEMSEELLEFLVDDNLLKLFLKRVGEYRANHIARGELTSLNAFEWDDTEEGYGYWDDLNDTFKDCREELNGYSLAGIRRYLEANNIQTGLQSEANLKKPLL